MPYLGLCRKRTSSHKRLMETEIGGSVSVQLLSLESHRPLSVRMNSEQKCGYLNISGAVFKYSHFVFCINRTEALLT